MNFGGLLIASAALGLGLYAHRERKRRGLARGWHDSIVIGGPRVGDVLADMSRRGELK